MKKSLVSCLAAASLATGLVLGPTGVTTARADTSTASAAAMVVGNTYTIGYYKNNPSQWPCGMSPDMPFFQSGLTWIQVLNTPSNAGPYYQLAKQYVAAVLNVENGAPTTPTLLAELDQATAFFQSNGPDVVLTTAQRDLVRTVAADLNTFNQDSSTLTPLPTCSYQMARELKIRQ